MMWLDLLFVAAPVVLLTAVVLAYVLYYRTIAALSSQMLLPDEPAAPRALPAPIAETWADTLMAGLSPQHHRTAVIALGGLTLEGDHVYHHALKVRGGALSVKGRVLFKGAVIVDGDVAIAGQAVFADGLLAHGDYVVHGRAQCRSWLKTGCDDAQQESAA